MALTKVWIRTLADGLIRADQVVGLHTHAAPSVAGTPQRWLVDAVLSVPAGSGTPEEWHMTVLHRTLLQTDRRPLAAPETLARLLASLDEADAAGVITPMPAQPPRSDAGASGVRFSFASFDEQREPATADSSNRESAHPGQATQAETRA